MRERERLRDRGKEKRQLVYFLFPTTRQDPVFPLQAKFGIN